MNKKIEKVITKKSRIITLDMMKDEETMKTLSEEEQTEMAELYVKNFIDKGHELPKIVCANCGKLVKNIFQVRGRDIKGERFYYCSNYCFEGYSAKRLKK